MEYRIASARRMFGFVTALLLIIMGIFLVSKPSLYGGKKADDFFIFMGVSLIIAGAFAFADIKATLITIDSDSITLKRVFRTRSLPLADIEGYRMEANNVICLVPKQGGGSPMRLSATFERYDELKAWVTNRYGDLDEQARTTEINNILDNDEYGRTKAERTYNLAKARLITRFSSAIAIIITFWAVLKTPYYELPFFILFALPWAGVYIAARYKGLVRLGTDKNSPSPTVIVLLLAPVVGTFARDMADYRLYTYERLWTFIVAGALLLTAACTVLCSKALERETSKIFTLIMTAIVSGAYTFGLVVFCNCHYDVSPTREFRPEITDKHISHGKSTSYYLTVSPWGRFTNEENISVSSGQYHTAQRGEQLHISLHEGRWYIPWYDITGL